MNPGLKKFFIYSIAPALIAGLFTVAPKIYEVITEPKASLSYRFTEGPQIAVDGEKQKVISLQVVNSGSRPLTLIEAEITAQNSNIAAASTSNASGLQTTIKNSESKTIVNAPKMHPGESFTISALVKTTLQSAYSPLYISVRSDETLGRTESLEKSKESRWAFLSGAMAALSVFLMSLFYQVKTLNIFSPLSRDEIIYYIAIATNTEELVPKFDLSETKLTYLRFADSLLKFGTTSDESRARAIRALTCLLLIKMHKTSKEIVIRNLKLLSKLSYDENNSQDIIKKGKSISGAVEIRDEIDSLLKSNLRA